MPTVLRLFPRDPNTGEGTACILVKTLPSSRPGSGSPSPDTTSATAPGFPTRRSVLHNGSSTTRWPLCSEGHRKNNGKSEGTRWLSNASSSRLHKGTLLRKLNNLRCGIVGLVPLVVSRVVLASRKPSSTPRAPPVPWFSRDVGPESIEVAPLASADTDDRDLEAVHTSSSPACSRLYSSTASIRSSMEPIELSAMRRLNRSRSTPQDIHPAGMSRSPRLR